MRSLLFLAIIILHANVNVLGQGTRLVKDIVKGRDSSVPQSFMKAGNLLYFNAGKSGTSDFYRSDGTEAGTILIKSNFSVNYNRSFPLNAIEYNGSLVFKLENSYQLWVSNGTASGTRLVADYQQHQRSPEQLTSFKNSLYFVLDYGKVENRGLYKWDGTTNAPVKVLGSTVSENFHILKGNDQLYFIDGMKVYDISKDVPVLLYDQTLVNKETQIARRITRVVLHSGKILLNQASPNTESGGSYGIRALDPLTKLYPWIIQEIGHGFLAASYWTSNMASMGGSLYYWQTSAIAQPGNSYKYGNELWKIDPSMSVSMVKSIVTDRSVPQRPIMANNGLVVFLLENQLWKSDGTGPGTTVLIDESQKIYIHNEQTSWHINNDRLFFIAEEKTDKYPNTIHGSELWVSDFTPAGTQIAVDFNYGTSGGTQGTIVSLDDKSVLLTASVKTGVNSEFGAELWITDGSPLLVDGKVPLKPTIVSFSPDKAKAGETVTITGTNFTNASDVQFGSIHASAFKVVSETSITVTVPDNADTGKLSVRTPGGLALSVNEFTSLVELSLQSFTPTGASSGTTVTITGLKFTGATKVSFGGTAAASFTVVSPTSIKAVVGSGVSGDVSVTTPLGTVSKAGFTYIVSPPTITSFSPATAGPGTTVTITGSNLTNASEVNFGGKSASSFTVISATEIRAITGLGSSSGVISVTTPGGTATRSGFIYLPAKPTITSFTPATGPTGTTVTITGTNFTGAQGVSFAGVQAKSFTVLSNTSVQAVVGDGASGTVTVVTPEGAIGASTPFTYQFAVPTITSFTPSTAAQGETVTITGTGFTGATFVGFGNTVTAFTVVSSTTITAVVGNGASGSVTVTNPAGTATATSFTFVTRPVIVSYSPQIVPKGATVTITGGNFTGATSVTFGGTPAASFKVESSNTITAVVGAGSSGSVSVTTGTGTSTLAGFIFTPKPLTVRAAAINKVYGSADPTLTYTFTGTLDAGDSFTGSLSRDAGTNAGTYAIKQGTLTAGPGYTITYVPANFVIGKAPLTITAENKTRQQGAVNPVFTASYSGLITGETSSVLTTAPVLSTVADAASNPGTYPITASGATAANYTITYVAGVLTVSPAPPVITSFTPAASRAGGTVSVTGNYFTGATAVSFGGTPAASFTIVSPTSITAVVGAGASGNVSVTTPIGTGTLAGYMFVPKPTIAAGGQTTFATGGSVLLSASPATGYTYKWSRDGVELSGATAVTYSARESGNYTVSISINAVSETSAGITVNTIFTLPASNFKITATGETCKTSNNGKITIVAEQARSYTATLTGNGVNKSLEFTNTLEFTDLPAGNYSVCITVSGQAEYKQCFDMGITEPLDLSVYAFVNKADNMVDLKLEGGRVYSVELNGKTYQSNQSRLSLPLSKGDNILRITADNLCQGVVEKMIHVDDNVKIFPNPFVDILNVDISDAASKLVKIEIRSLNGELVFKGQMIEGRSQLTMELAAIKPGLYVLRVLSGNTESIYKVIKK